MTRRHVRRRIPHEKVCVPFRARACGTGLGDSCRSGDSAARGFACRLAMADDDLPIDVHYDKLIDWLVDRKKVSKDWRKKLAGVHAKLSELARDLPNTLTKTHGLGVPDSSLVDAAGEPQRWDYFRAVLVRDRIVAGADLREDRSKSDPDGSEFPDANANATDPSRDDDTEKENEKEKTRGLFGQLTGKAKAWDDVVRMYEKDALHLPECGSTMTRFADYDAPFARREKERLAKQLGDAERREAEHRRSAAAAKEKFAKMCFDVFGTEKGATIAESVDGDKNDKNDLSFFQSLVDGLADGLDAVFDAAVAAARSDAVGEAAEHYARWTDWAHGERIRAGLVSQETGESLDGRVTVESLTPHLARLRAMATSAEAELIGRDFEKSRKAAEKDAEDAAFASTSDVDVATDVEVATSADGAQVEPPAGGIDWDVGVVDAKVEPPAGGIDWDVGVAAESTGTPAAVEIDWDVGDVVEVEVDETIGVETIEAPIEIDWDVRGFVVEDAGDARAETNVEKETNGFVSTKTLAETNDSSSSSFGRAFTDREFRACVLDDLLELRAFLTQRAADAGASGESATLLASAPPEIRARFGDAAELTKLAAACEEPVRVLAEDTAGRLLLVSASERYRKRLANDLVTAGRLESKFCVFADDARQKRDETRRSLRREALKAEASRKALREVKRFAERAISTMYKGRTVHIIGEINNALAG